MKHIKTPLYLNSSWITDADGKIVAETLGQNPHEIAEIIQCVNAHDDLVAALKIISIWAEQDGNTAIKNAATEALKKAGAL